MAMPLAAGAPAALLASLPTYLTRLFGADQAAARSRAAVLTQRLVTLLGPGGSGKTRLAVEVAQALRHQPVWPAEPAGTAPRFDRIAFVPLVACTRESQCLDAMARALHLPGSAGAGNAAASAGTHTGAQAEGDTNPDAQAGVNDQAVSRLCTALAGQRVLLVLDNFEQLVGVADTAVGALLAQLPDLHVLVTSRRALGLDGETCITAEPLVLPAAAAPASAAGANPAVALFVDRARAVRADFHLSDRNAAAIVSLVRLLHGMPLAIELAASRVRSFPPAEMLALLRPAAATAAAAARAAGESGAPSASSANAPTLQRPSAADAAGPQLTLLARSGPRAGHDPRHASMSQVIDWSWRLLDAPAQQLLQALTLFAADASAAAVAAVVARPVADTAAGLDELVSHSLVRVAPAPAQVGPAAEADAGAPRFDLLEPVREFAAARLPPADAAAGRARLRAWLLAWAQALGTATVPARVAPELATVQAVLASATADGAPQDALALAVALRAYWDTDGLPGSILSALEQALQALPVQAQPMSLAPPQAALVADSHELLAYLRFEAGYVDAARQHAEAALVAAAADPARRAAALVRRAWVEIAGGRSGVDDGAGPARLRTDLAEALALAQQCGHREAQARALHQQAVLATHSQDDWRGAEALLAQSQALWLQLGDRRKAFARQRNRAQCWLHMDREAEALASLERCEEAAREDGDWVGQIDSLLTLSSLRATRHEWALALSLAQRCVVVSWQRWHRHGLAYALWNPPRLLARLHRPEPAVRLMGFAATFWESGFGPLGKADKAYVRRVRGLAAAQIGAARVQALWLEGAAMNVAQAVALTLQR
jgi:predicted ATPase